jgi:hypothetical protein
MAVVKIDHCNFANEGMDASAFTNRGEHHGCAAQSHYRNGT